MSHVIIEGPDGAGKTHLAWLICAQHGHSYHHEGPPPKDENVLHHYAGLLRNAARPTVFDRLHLGELVYGPLLRGESKLGPDEVTLMHRLIRGTGTAVVRCQPRWDTCLRNNRSKDELIKDEGVLHSAWKAWVALDLGPNAHLYDYEMDRSNGTMSILLQLLDHPSLPPGTIGSPEASVLFVGAQPNGELDLPFFSTTNSSAYLNNAIKAAGFMENGIAFTNAALPNGDVRDLRWVFSQLPFLRTIVTLGVDATQAVYDQRVPFAGITEIPHPQFWRRFHAAESAVYVEKLREVRYASL